ncbi:DEAD/DEAH box helicase, partial [Myxococcota bacterium]|nr:DEAD/DEAH box helicase [Myxococcota bacterium]MBU1537615.1 DEAD/DEAH box helicase [Myxococcota bacterium]
LAKQDLIVQSRTGSGKTGAFVLSMLDDLEAGAGAGQALILVPTRELANQVAQECEMLGGPFGLRSIAIYGGVAYGTQSDAFNDGYEIIVATPGRLLDHLLKNNINLKAIRYLIFDEADRMLSMGFLPDMKAVRNYLPRGRRVHTYMFSATFPPDILGLAWQFMEDPRLLSLSRDHVHVASNAHIYYEVPQMQKGGALASIIDYENPSSALVFCNRKDEVNYVAVVLAKFGFVVDQISSDLSQIAREKVMERLRKGEVRILVATDVAARGIDIPEISHVFMYGSPDDPESYIHRSGRTGRAGAIGTAISVVSDVEKIALNKVIKKYDITFDERTLPTPEELAATMGERIIARTEALGRELTRHEQENVERLVPYAQKLAESPEGINLLAMVLNEAYQKAFRCGTPQDVVSKTSPQKEGGRGRSRDSGRGDSRPPRGGRPSGRGGSQGRDSRSGGRSREGGRSRTGRSGS